MSLNPNGVVNISWNMSRENDPDYSLELTGTVVSLQEVQARTYNASSNRPGAPRFWDDGNPVMNIRMALADPNGALKSITFSKAGKKQKSGEKPSLHMQLFNLTNGNMMDLIGKTIHLWTWPANPTTGQAWGLGNPRLFGVEEITDGTKYELVGLLPSEYTVPQLLCDDAAQGGQVQPQPAPQYQQPMPQYQQPMPQYQQPVPQYQPQYQQQMPQYQPVAQPVMPQTAVQPVANMAQTAQMPQGMDPTVAQAMQAIGVQNVQPVAEEQPQMYNTDGMPF